MLCALKNTVFFSARGQDSLDKAEEKLGDWADSIEGTATDYHEQANKKLQEWAKWLEEK